MRINTNASAIFAHRNLLRNTATQTKTLERLSSGLKINRGADAPAQLQISENLRAQTVGLKQSIDNSEMAISLMQTGEAALDEVSRSLVKARQLAIHAANEAVNDDTMLEADQQELDQIIGSINRIAKNTQYGKNYLLDGSGSGNGVTTGANLTFVGAETTGVSSGVNGYDIDITRAAARSKVSGTVALTQEIINAGEQITIVESGRAVDFRTVAGTSVEQTLNQLSNAINAAGINVELVRPDSSVTSNNAPQMLTIRHTKYGSEPMFQVSSNTGGLLSKVANVAERVKNGADIVGEIAGEEAVGKGQLLTGAGGFGSKAEGISVRYSGENTPPMGQRAGTITFTQNSLTFQIGGNANQTARVSFKSVKSNKLGNGVTNGSGFRSFADIQLLDAKGAQDSLQIIDKAIKEVAANRGYMGAFQRNTLESNLNYLRIAHENVMNSESVIRDADMAQEMTKFTRNQIMMESSTAMLAQANQMPKSILKLLG
ncbi:MAG: flagellin [Deltaproteobacteria bacterium]|jgi:flagellin|nr:flagellin [Deltaproteobacteria bacterium]